MKHVSFDLSAGPTDEISPYHKLFFHGGPRHNKRGANIYVIPPIESKTIEEWRELLHWLADYPPHPEMNCYWGMKAVLKSKLYEAGYWWWNHKYGLWQSVDKEVMGLRTYRHLRVKIEGYRKAARLRDVTRPGPQEYMKRKVGVEVRRKHRMERKRKGKVVVIAADRTQEPLSYVKWVLDTIG